MTINYARESASSGNNAGEKVKQCRRTMISRASRIVVRLKTGPGQAFPPVLAEGLADRVTRSTLRNRSQIVRLGPSWPKLDIGAFIPALLQGTVFSSQTSAMLEPRQRR
jgi:hypothetical protein